MVNLEKLNYADLLIRFRQMKPMHQAAVAGLFFLVVYVPYAYFLLRLSLVESISMAVIFRDLIHGGVLFHIVHYHEKE